MPNNKKNQPNQADSTSDIVDKKESTMMKDGKLFDDDIYENHSNAFLSSIDEKQDWNIYNLVIEKEWDPREPLLDNLDFVKEDQELRKKFDYIGYLTEEARENYLNFVYRVQDSINEMSKSERKKNQKNLRKKWKSIRRLEKNFEEVVYEAALFFLNKLAHDVPEAMIALQSIAKNSQIYRLAFYLHLDDLTRLHFESLNMGMLSPSFDHLYEAMRLTIIRWDIKKPFIYRLELPPKLFKNY